MTADKIKLVVAEGNTLGYILPQLPNYLCILQASILKGSRFSNSSGSVNLPKEWRLASIKDFEDFNFSIKGYIECGDYEFDTSYQSVMEKEARFKTVWNTTTKNWETDFSQPFLF